MLGRDAIANILKQEGVEWLACFPHNLIIESAATIGIRPILTRTERVAANIADGYTRISNGERIGVFLAQAGPGAENAFSGVAQSYADSIPILGLPGGTPTRRNGVHPGFSSPANYQRITKWTDQINHADRVPEMMRRAFTYLRSGHPAPVVLEVPGDVMDGEMSGSGLDYKPVKRIRVGADPVAVKEAVAALLKAKCPLIHAGQGVLFAQAWDELRGLAELLQTPVMTTMPGKSAFPENHPLSAGSGGHTGSKVAAHFLKESDLIFGVGCSFSMSPFAAPIPPGKFVIHSSVDEQDINKDLAADVAVLGDAKLVLRQMIEEAKAQLTPASRKEDSSAADEVKAIKEQWMQEWMPKFTSDETRPSSPTKPEGRATSWCLSGRRWSPTAT
jgi:acetolactate synthase-1/2/3 large subunit